MARISRKEFEDRIEWLRRRRPGWFPREMRMEAPQGWIEILERLSLHVDRALGEKYRAKFQWLQWKEKFGLLRAYWEGGPVYVDVMGQGAIVLAPTTRTIPAEVCDRIERSIRAAMRLSSRTCQFCGERGRLRNRNYLFVACDRCFAAPDPWEAS